MEQLNIFSFDLTRPFTKISTNIKSKFSSLHFLHRTLMFNFCCFSRKNYQHTKSWCKKNYLRILLQSYQSLKVYWDVNLCQNIYFLLETPQMSGKRVFASYKFQKFTKSWFFSGWKRKNAHVSISGFMQRKANFRCNYQVKNWL